MPKNGAETSGDDEVRPEHDEVRPTEEEVETVDADVQAAAEGLDDGADSTAAADDDEADAPTEPHPFAADRAEDVISRLEAQNQALEARLRTVSAAYKDQQDDMRATRERLERQAQVKEEMRRGEVVMAVFEPFENLRRSITSVRSGASPEEVARGLEIVERQLMEAFQRLGLEEVPGKGARFDPNLHEAISAIPVTDPALDDVVIEVFSAGYRIGTRLIQPARVVIGKLSETLGEA